MENLKNSSIAMNRIVKMIAVCMIIFHLILAALAASGQELSYVLTGHATHANNPASQVNKVRSIYTIQIGVREKQPNSGPQVEKYLRYVNLPKGNPWCAAFVCWVFGEANVANPRSGWSPALFGESHVIWVSGESRTKSQEQGLPQNAMVAYWPGLATGNRQPACRSRRPVAPAAGDIFGLFFPEKHRIAHVGFIDEWKDPWVTTVEGNTNVLGSRDGDGVYRKRRLVRSVYKVARYVD